MKKALLKDIAETMGISVSQASRALNHQGRVSDDTRNQVMRLAKKMNYRNLSNRRRKRIAVLADYFGDFTVHILNQLLLESGRMKFSFYVIPFMNLDKLNDRFFDGAILLSQNPEQTKWCEKFKIPLVVINQYGNVLENIASVFPDADHEVRTAMTHFLNLGHRKIARIHFVSRKTCKRVLSRGVDEFDRIAEENGIRDQVCSVCVGKPEEKVIEEVLRLVDEGFTAFLVILTDWTPCLLHRLRQAGLRIPEDISLITYENNHSASYERPFVKCLIARKRFFVNFRLGDLKKCFLSCSYSRSYKVLPRTPHDKCPSGASIYLTSFLFIWRMTALGRIRSRQDWTNKQNVKEPVLCLFLRLSSFLSSEIMQQLFSLF